MGNACLSSSLCQRQQLLLREIANDKIEPKKNSSEIQKTTVKVNTLVSLTTKDQQKRGGEAANGVGTKAKAQNEKGIIGGELTIKDKEIIARCWRKRIVTDRPDLFHKTMLRCIEASPKLNEIIACGRYCYRDLTKWPKLNRICQAQFKFYERLIYELNMDERRMREECTRLGQTHAEYAQFGLKPHFLDIYQQSLIEIISKMDFADNAEKEETIWAFGRLIRFIVEAMISGYGQKVAQLRSDRRGSGGTESTDERGALSDDELKNDQNVID